jgi:hypothetical protein
MSKSYTSSPPKRPRACSGTALALAVALGGVMATVLDTGPKSRGFKRGQGDGFKGDKNPQHTFLRMGSKAEGPMS